MMFAAAAVCAVAPAYAGTPDDLVTRPLVLDEGALDLRLTAELAVQPGGVGRPMSLAPDAWWGISPRWTLGVIHSSASLDRIDAGATLCVRQVDAPPCNQLYHGSGLDIRFSAVTGSLAVAPRLRLVIRDLDPIKPAMTLGGTVRWAFDRFAIATDPYLRLPLANRRLGNRAQLVLPLWLTVQPATGWAIALHVGYDADLAVFRDGGHGPVSLAITARATPAFDIAVEGGWSELLGSQHDVKLGAMTISADWHP
jgi:hypothetical protein